MTPPSRLESDQLPLASLRHIDEVCGRFEGAWGAGQEPRVEDYLAGEAEPLRRQLFRQLLLAELEQRAEQGAAVIEQPYRERFPEYADLVHTLFEEAIPAGATTVLPRQAGAPPTAKAAPGGPVHIPGYEVLGELGRGGMGVVYLATHLQLRRQVALKVILAGAHADASALDRFHHEARTVARLNHPNIVQVYEIGSHEGLPFIALEYVAGGSLARRLAGSPQTPRVTARLVETLARAVHAAHEQGIVHRDLKPANILLSRGDGRPAGPPGDSTPGEGPPDNLGLFEPKITDFGLAKQLGPEVEGLPDVRTKTGLVVGTPGYMAPEQARGSRTIGPATDVHALGVLLYEMLTGRPPFLAADVLGTLELVCHQEPVPPSQLQARTPRDLQTICLKCLHKEPQRRYATAQALADDLRRFREGVPILARPVSRLGRGWRWARRKPVLATLVALSIVLALTVVIGSTAAAILLRVEHANVVAERERRQQRIVESLFNVSPAGVALLLGEMSDNREVFLPLAQARWEDKSLGPNERLRLAMALTRLGQPRTDDLVRAVATAPAGECANLAAAFGSLPDRGTSVLRQAFARAEGALRFRFAVLLLELGDPEPARGLLAFKQHPNERTQFVRQFSGWHGDLAALPEVLRRHDDSALRSGLCAALGRLDPGRLSPTVASALRGVFVELHRQAQDAGTHATAGWALRRWGQELPLLPASRGPTGGRQWYVTAQGLTMIRAEPPASPGRPAPRYPWAMYVSDREVSVRLFRRFLTDPGVAAPDKPADWPGVDPAISATDDCPVHNVNLHDVMLFCNWLSRQEGRDPCYRPAADRPGAWTCRFGANGYRLPTMWEWEYAGRTETRTPFFFGDDVTLLPDYANVLLRRAEPGGRRLPNDWGLFDVLGNVWDVCLDGPLSSGPFEPHRATVVPRGGSYGTGSLYSNSDHFGTIQADVRSAEYGFRVVYREGQPSDIDAAHIALEVLNRLIGRYPETLIFRRQRGAVHVHLGRKAEAADDLAAYLVAPPQDPQGVKELAQVTALCADLYRECGQWSKAALYLARVVAAQPENHTLAFSLAPLLLAANDVSGYHRHRRRMLERWRQTKDVQEAERTAKVCSLLAIGDKEGAVVLELAQRAVRLAGAKQAGPQQLGRCLLAEGMALYRCRRPEDAVTRAIAALNTQGMTPEFHVAANLLLAMALHRLGRTEDARTAFTKATSIKVPEEGTPEFTGAWNDWLICRFLRREAEALLSPQK
jgi:serine/threonine protein kinase/tetratricopeptide (TPR) repeat protein